MSTPDPLRLAILTDLRQDAGLTLTQMARRCGLRGNQSHQTAGAWERGVYVPSERRRAAMIGYLWDDLLLRRDPEKFEEVWTVLEDEWRWEPISDIEWGTFTTQERPGRADLAEALAAETIRAPYQAPSVPASFVGRTAEMDALKKRLSDSEGQPVALVGMGGIGKTTMAAFAASQLREHFAGGVLWAHTQVSDPLDILNSWAKAYGHDYSSLTDVQSRASAMRNLLADKQALIVLDDVSSPSHVQPLLPGHAGCAVLVTTRSEDVAAALGATVLRLPELAPTASLDLLARLAGQKRLHAELSEAEAICALLHNYPLAIEIVGQLLVARPRRRLADTAHRLRNAQGRLDLAIADRDVRTSFLVSWEALDAPHRKAYATLGVFEARSFTAEALAGVLEIDFVDAMDRLETLAARSLVSFVEDSRYRQHPLLADFAREQLGKSSAAWRQFADFELEYVRGSVDDNSRLEPEWENVMAGLRTATELTRWPTVLEYADLLTTPWLRVSQFERARSAYPLACKAGENMDDARAVALNLNRWAYCCIEQGDFDEAREKLDICLPVATSLGDPLLIGEISYSLARLSLELEAYDDALTHVETCLDIHVELENSDQGILARHLRALIAYRQGDYQTAETQCNEALNIHKRTPMPLGAVRTNRLLMDIAIEQNQPEKALALGAEATTIAKQAQLDDDLIEVQYGIAVTHRILGRYVAALKLTKDIVQATEKRGKVLFMMLAYHEQSVVLKLMGRYHDALLAANRCLAFVVEVEANYNHMVYLLNLGEVLEGLGDRIKARSTYQNALRMAEPIGHPRSLIIQERLLALGVETSSMTEKSLDV